MSNLSQIQRKLLEYYSGLYRRAGGIPSRADVRPQDMKEMLAWIVLAESSGPGNLVPTVVGSAIDEILHVAFTGKNLVSFYPPEIAVGVDQFYQAILTHPCGGVFTRNLEGKFGRVKGYQSLLLPLKGRSGEINRMIGAISVAGAEDEIAGFGRPADLKTLKILDLAYLDIGHGVPETVPI